MAQYEGYKLLSPEEMAAKLLALETEIQHTLVMGSADHIVLAETMYFHHRKAADLYEEMMRD
jgi:hypothetical protein